MSPRCSSFLLTLLAFSSAISALPGPAPGPIHIPLTRRSRTQSVDWNAAADRLRSRYGYEPLTTQMRKRASSATLSTLNLDGDSSYLGSVQIGTPPQTLDVILDTGSSDLWVAAPDCAECIKTTIPFESNSSSSFQSSTSEIKISYGSGEVVGAVSQDTVQMGGFAVQSQTFTYVTQLTSGLLLANASGLMGLAFEALAMSKSTPFWETLAGNGAWSSPEMGFSLTRFDDDSSATTLEPGGTFTLGGTDTSQYTGDIDFVNLQNADQPTFWFLTVTALTLNGTSITVPTGNSALAAIDTGTTLIGCPTSVVDSFYQQIPGFQSLGNSMPGFFSFPCGSTANVTMSFGSKTWPLNPVDILLEPVDRSGTQCLGALFDLSGGESGPIIPPNNENPSWVVGDTFLKNVYSVFRSNPASVGFAELSSAGGGSPGSPSGTSSSSSSSPGTNPTSTATDGGSTPPATSSTASGSGGSPRLDLFTMVPWSMMVLATCLSVPWTLNL